MNPLTLLTKAITAVPAVRYALGVAGVAAVVAIILGLKLNPQVAVLGTLTVIAFMFVLLIFAKVAGQKDSNALLLPAQILVWFYTIATVVVTTLFISSYFAHRPISFEKNSDQSASLKPNNDAGVPPTSNNPHPAIPTPTADSKPRDTPKAKKPTSPIPAPVATIQIGSQKEVASADAEFPYGREVILTTTKDVSPTALRVRFSGEVSKMYGNPPGMMFQMAQGGIETEHPDTVRIQWSAPPFSIAEPVKITVYSKNFIEAIHIESVPFSFPLPQGYLK